MKIDLRFFATLLLLSHAQLYAEYEKVEICQDLVLESKESLDFNSNEKLFLCGKSDIKEWQNIPDYQTKLHLTASLQAKGYHFLKFKKENQKLIVNTGPKVHISKVTFKGLDIDIDQDRYIAPIGKAMTPKYLEEVRGFILERLSASAYPCAKVDVRGFAKEELVEINIDLQNERVLTKVNSKYDDRFYASLFERFYAFELNKPYNSQLVELTNQRILNSGVVQHSQFSSNCNVASGEVAIDQKVLLGKTKVFSFGVGGSTEDGPLAQIKWKNARIGKNGSQANVSLYTSFRQQRLQLLGTWYPFKNIARSYFEPSLTIKRTSEVQLKTLESSASMLYGISQDTMGNRYEFKVGPSYNYYNSIEAALNTTQYYPSLNIQSSILSHDFEYYLSDPINGFKLNFNSELVSDAMGANFNAYQFKLSGHYLKNIGNYYPAHLILGFRFGLMTTAGTTGNDSEEELPLKFRYFIGGAQNLRGFSRQELPRGGTGSYAAFYTSVEARSYTVITPSWQPLVFIDFGMLGDESTTLSTPLYWSPGVGMRWDSPVGVFRTTMAHGYISRAKPNQPEELSHYQFFLSYGKEF